MNEDEFKMCSLPQKKTGTNFLVYRV